MPPRPLSILFVCYANLARSPMAEAVMRRMAHEAGLDQQVLIDSAGTTCLYPGEPACSGTLDVLDAHGIAHPSLSRQLEYDDLNRFDYVYAMDRRVLNFILRHRQGTTAAVDLFLAPAQRIGLVSVDEVPDPFPNGDFQATYQLVRLGCLGILRTLPLPRSR
ncbi:MAG: arsenate reductase/protein-tyrosine-phosphatase family protein [Candidatus Flexifilum sp.]|jgi:protein-tyrosine phosphatase